MLALSLSLKLTLAAGPAVSAPPAPPPAAPELPWRQLENWQGVLMESRDVPGSSFEEIRITTDHAAPPERVCEAVWGGNTQKLERGFKQRQTLLDTPQERLTYERVGAPLAHDRDYTVHAQRALPTEEGCTVNFETQNEKGPPPQPGAVRVPAIHGYWQVSRVADGKSHIVYMVYSEPGGAIPAWMAKGGQRNSAKDWMKIILGRVDAPEQHANR